MHLVINGVEVEVAECVLHFRPEAIEDATALIARLRSVGDALNAASPPVAYEQDVRHDNGVVRAATMKLEESPSTLVFNILCETDFPSDIQAIWDAAEREH